MFEELYQGIQAKLDALESGAPPAIPDWRATPIAGWNGFVKEAERIAGPNWWQKPASAAEKSLAELLKRAGLGELKTSDGKEEENVHAGPSGPTASEVAEHQQTTRHDEGEYAEYFPKPNDNAWAWADALATKVDTNTPKSRSWYSALLSYIHKFPQKTKASDLDAETVAKLVKEICDGGHHE